MKNWAYILILVTSLCLSQWVFDGMRKEKIFPLATWNLFSQLPIKRDIVLLYFENTETGELCYFYLCPGIDKSKITSYHPYHIVRWRREVSDVGDYFEGKVDLKKLHYKIKITVEHTTMVEKWKQISNEMRSKRLPDL